MTKTSNWDYKIIRNAIPKSYIKLLTDYFTSKKEVYQTMLDKGYIDEHSPQDFGTMFDKQMPGPFSIYGDVMNDMLLSNLKPRMEEETGMSLVPTYSYMRTYTNGDELPRHKDRPSCEISTTLNLDGDMWPIFLKMDSRPNEEIEVKLNPGDMLIYRGCDQEHWRNEFRGNYSMQTFLHYNNADGPFGKTNMYDNRAHLGLPEQFRNSR
jgi:hypothetical protein